MRREAEVDAGVCNSGELVALDDPDETEADRPLRAEVFIAIGSEGLCSLVKLLLDILVKKRTWGVERQDEGRGKDSKVVSRPL